MPEPEQHNECGCEPVGYKKIGEHLLVQTDTVIKWNKQREVLVLGEPQWTVGKDPAWCWPHWVRPLADQAGRLPGTEVFEREAWARFNRSQGPDPRPRWARTGYQPTWALPHTPD